MSGKNRAFALAIATAALVGFSAPMAMAATTYGPSNTGFNNDSVLNLSNNQLSNQTCTGGVQTGVSGAVQTITSVLGGIATPTAASGDVTPSQSSDCSQTPSNTNSTTANTAPTTAPSMMGWQGDDSNVNNAGFNNDSVLNVSGNQLQNQTCTGGVQTAASAAVQTLVAFGDILAPGLTSGDITPTNTSSCTQTPSNSNTTTANS